MRKSRSISEAVTRDLALRIIREELSAGQQLVGENELAVQYDVSRTSIRNAMHVLSAKGFLSVQAKRRTTVNSSEHWNCLDHDVITWLSEVRLDHGTVEQIMTMRLMLEPSVAAIAAANATAADLSDLEQAWLVMQEGQKTANGALFEKGDIAFHMALFKATHNLFLTSMGKALAETIVLSFRQTLEQDVSLTLESVEEHRAVMEAVRLRQVKQAHTKMLAIVTRSIAKGGWLKDTPILKHLT